LQAFDNSFALIRDALPLKRFALCFGFGFLDDEDFFGFAADISDPFAGLELPT